MIYGTCDIETLGKTTESVVIEVACLKIEQGYLETSPHIFNRIKDAIANYQQGDEPPKLINAGYEFLVCNFSIFGQIAKGREIDPNTVAWHQRTPESAAYLNKCFTNAQDSSKDLVLFSSLQKFFEPVDEIWFNGLSFDPPILKDLAKTVGFKEDLWHFRKEFDNRTIYRKFIVHEHENPSIKDIPAHTALIDCFRNILSLRDLHHTEKDNELRIRKEPLDPTKTRV